MTSRRLSLLLLPLLVLVPVLRAGPGCAPCDPAGCAPLPAAGCPAGSLRDSCGCCAVCAATEGEACGGRRAAARRCGPGLECGRSGDNKRSKTGVCACKTNYQVCGSDGTTYRSGCALRSASMAAARGGREPISVQNKGRCAAALLCWDERHSGVSTELLPGVWQRRRLLPQRMLAVRPATGEKCRHFDCERRTVLKMAL